MKSKIQLVKGDITELQVEAIVNAANHTLCGGGGVDGAIHRAAGPQLLEECKILEGCAVGQAKITKGYALPAKYVIHTVGPIWRGGGRGESQLLAACYAATLKIALEYKIKSVAFPAISCGVYGYPISQAAMIAVKETTHFLELHVDFEKIVFVCFDETIYDAYQYALDALHHG